MAAISSIIFSLLKPDETVIVHKLRYNILLYRLSYLFG